MIGKLPWLSLTFNGFAHKKTTNCVGNPVLYCQENNPKAIKEIEPTTALIKITIFLIVFDKLLGGNAL